MDGLDGMEEGEAGGECDRATNRPAGFADMLRHLRGLALPCFPPVGVGSFDVLYASEREVVVWYSPAREDHRSGEVTIPCPRLAVAWAALTGGESLDEAALERCGGSVAGGRWLLALLAQLPGVRVQTNPLCLAWSPPQVEPAPVPVATNEPAPTKRRSGAAGGTKPRRARTKAAASAHLQAYAKRAEEPERRGEPQA